MKINPASFATFYLVLFCFLLLLFTGKEELPSIDQKYKYSYNGIGIKCLNSITYYYGPVLSEVYTKEGKLSRCELLNASTGESTFDVEFEIVRVQ
jgi:hypothetical protein